MTNSSLFSRLRSRIGLVVATLVARGPGRLKSSLRNRNLLRLILTLLILVLVFWLGLHSPIGPVEANLPLAALSPSPTPQLIWEGRIVSDTPYVTPPSGSILRVSVEGLVGVPITVSAYDWSTTALSGSKT